jgi:hypothetical protein
MFMQATGYLADSIKTSGVRLRFQCLKIIYSTKNQQPEQPVGFIVGVRHSMALAFTHGAIVVQLFSNLSLGHIVADIT